MNTFLQENIGNIYHSPRVLFTFFCILVALIVAKIMVLLFQIKVKSKEMQNVSSRITSWWFICMVIILSFLGGKIGACLLFCGVSALGFWEYLKALKLTSAPKPLLIASYLFIGLQYGIIYINDYDLFLIFIPLASQIVLGLTLVFMQKINNFIQNIGLLHWGLLLTTFCLSHLAFFMNLDNPKTSEAEPLGLITYVLILTQFNDVAQFIFGKSLGRLKIIPRVSPNKTLEGLIGGIVATSIFSYYLGPFLTPLNAHESIGAGILLSLSGFFGDVFMSSVKRDRQIKDFSNFIPGHGGVLDRVDSLIIAAPVFFHYYWMFFPGIY